MGTPLVHRIHRHLHPLAPRKRTRFPAKRWYLDAGKLWKMGGNGWEMMQNDGTRWKMMMNHWIYWIYWMEWATLWYHMFREVHSSLENNFRWCTLLLINTYYIIIAFLLFAELPTQTACSFWPGCRFRKEYLDVHYEPEEKRRLAYRLWRQAMVKPRYHNWLSHATL